MDNHFNQFDQFNTDSNYLANNGEGTSVFGSQDYNGMQSNPSYPTVDAGDVPKIKEQNGNQGFRSLELSLISNQRMNEVVQKMKTGEFSMQNTRFSNGFLNNSKGEKIFSDVIASGNVVSSNQLSSILNSTAKQE